MVVPCSTKLADIRVRLQAGSLDFDIHEMDIQNQFGESFDSADYEKTLKELGLLPRGHLVLVTLFEDCN